MISINKVIIVGQLIKILPKKETSKMMVQEIEIETEDTFFDRKKNSNSTKKEKVKVTFFGKSAEEASSIPLWSLVSVEGKVRSSTFKTQKGVDFDTTTVSGSKIGFISSKTVSENEAAQVDLDDFNDDIPF